ncbi:hypothetical protein PybrP1_011592 [[Pythium] brassicae (nom. inval.)]|nr:hypothetical protein PybrP1_011592 [[Pythium] brassicae (nom. inval.)]
MARHQGRTSVKGDRVRAKLHKRTQYKFGFKRAAILRYREHGIDDTIARFFSAMQRDSARKLVSKWSKNNVTIATMASNMRTGAEERIRAV